MHLSGVLPELFLINRYIWTGSDQIAKKWAKKNGQKIGFSRIPRELHKINTQNYTFLKSASNFASIGNIIYSIF